MHPVMIEEIARQRILEFHREAEAHRRAPRGRTGRGAPVAQALAGRVRRLVARRPVTT